MSKVVKFEQKSFSEDYPLASEEEVPFEYELNLIDYNKSEVDKYPVILWHSLLKKHYGPPLEYEGFLCKPEELGLIYNHDNRSKETVFFRIKSDDHTKFTFLDISEDNLKKYQSGELTLDLGFINWKYFIKLLSGTVMVIETQESHSSLKFGLINCNEDTVIREGEKFISYLLDEIRKNAKNLINPKKRLKDNNVFIYYLWNGYLSNYFSGKQMLQVSEKQEDNIKKEMLRDDIYSVLTDSESLEYIEQLSLCSGMFYSSAISYFFIAFEGFSNLIFHSFIKFDLKDIDYETRFDIKQKLKLMPSLCYGFKNEKIEMPSELEKEFDMLKRYRNEIFHSKSGNNRLKSILTLQDSFIYTYQIDDFEDYFLPSNKMRLESEDVIKVKSILDSLIGRILDSMEDKIREPTENYILKRSLVPFVKNKDGVFVMGDSEARV